MLGSDAVPHTRVRHGPRLKLAFMGRHGREPLFTDKAAGGFLGTRGAAGIFQFVDPGYGLAVLSFLLLGPIVQTCRVIYLTVLIFAGARLAQQFRRHCRMSAAGTGFVGTAFLGFSVKLATASMR
jgi:hypothetical protein